MRICLLGPMQISMGDSVVHPGPAKQQCVLAVLAVEAGRVVSVDALVDRVWGDRPPPQVRNLVQTYVARLRKSLSSAGVDGPALLRFEHGGYRLAVKPEQVDTFGVRQALTASAADPASLAEQLRTVLADYRGEPLAGLEGEWAEQVRRELAEQRTTARRRLAEATLELGGHAEVLVELAELSAMHPMDEDLVGLRMLALYRCGRQADALEAYRTMRALLVEELGDDPGPELRELHDRILRRDPMLDAPRAEPTDPLGGAPRWSARDDLPRETADFTGRRQEVDRLVDSGTGRPEAVVRVIAIDGTVGVGKSALALRVARRLAAHYPDGRLYLDLCGHNARRGPFEAGEALAVLLRSVGVPESRIPDTEAERASAWRAQVSNRRMLLLLDDAADAVQVRPLLPGSAGSLVIVTSRVRLGGLTGIDTLTLEPMSLADALALFDTVVGPVAAEDPTASAEVVRLCGCLPLAVELAAARLRNRPSWSVAELLARLTDSRRGLRELRSGDLSLTAAFEGAYRQLPEPARRMFRRLGGHPGPDLDTSAAAALDGTDIWAADEALEQLLDSRLLTQSAPDRYRLLAPLRHYALHLAAHDPDEKPVAALSRLLRHYTAMAADPPPGWFDLELDNLLAAVEAAAERGVEDGGWRLALAMFDHLEDRRRYRTGARIYESALASAQASADRRGVVAMLRCAGVMHWRCGEQARAQQLLADSAGLADEIGDVMARAEASYHLGGLAVQSGRPEAAVAHYNAAITVFRDRRDDRRLGDALNNLGVACRSVRDYRAAVSALEEALALRRARGDRRGEAGTLSNLADVQLALGDRQRAMATLLPVLELTRAAGDVREEIAAHTNIGILALTDGDRTAADDHFTRALELARRLGDPYEEVGVMVDSAVVWLDHGSTTGLPDLLSQALAIAERISASDEQARALTVLGQVAARSGRPEEAREHWLRASSILERLGSAQLAVVHRLLDDLSDDGLPTQRRRR